MKIWCTILFLLIALSVSGQTSIYHPFPDSNAMWNIHGQSWGSNMCSFNDPVIMDSYLSYFISGDTIINSLTYHKIYTSGYSHEHCLYGNIVENWWTYDSTYQFSMRQELNSKKVYIYNFQEDLLYDFSLEVGDTIPQFWDCAVITSIDSVLIGNSYRKRFNLSALPYTLIEGIGSTSGLDHPVCIFENSGTLTCFVQNDATLYPDGDYICERITDIKKIPFDNILANFSPNPFHSTTILELKNEFEGSEIILYNTLGENVLQLKIVSNKMEINRDRLSNGIYFYHITNIDGKFLSGRLTIE
jgi:hypothetical protein